MSTETVTFGKRGEEEVSHGDIQGERKHEGEGTVSSTKALRQKHA